MVKAVDLKSTTLNVRRFESGSSRDFYINQAGERDWVEAPNLNLALHLPGENNTTWGYFPFSLALLERVTVTVP